MTQKTELTMFRARGAPRQLGRQVGEAAANHIHRMLASYRQMIESARGRPRCAVFQRYLS